MVLVPVGACQRRRPNRTPARVVSTNTREASLPDRLFNPIVTRTRPPFQTYYGRAQPVLSMAPEGPKPSNLCGSSAESDRPESIPYLVKAQSLAVSLVFVQKLSVCWRRNAASIPRLSMTRWRKSFLASLAR